MPRTGHDRRLRRRAVLQVISIHVPRTGHDQYVHRHRPHLRDFNPRAPYGARRSGLFPGHQLHQFQSTCPVRGTTHTRRPSRQKRRIFQSTCPVRGTTGKWNLGSQSAMNFNPRAPYGARRLSAAVGAPEQEFQSTCPVRGTTTTAFNITVFNCISIHVPRTGHDERSQMFQTVINEFQSTCPVRGTTCTGHTFGWARRISIHVPRTGHDIILCWYCQL